MERRFSAALLIAIMLLGSAGCGIASPKGGVTGDAACAMIVHYHHRSYLGTTVHVVPPQGDRAGLGVVPGCNDTGQQHPADEKIPVARLRGVLPNVALLMPGQNDVVLVRRGIHRLPPEIRALLHAPICDKQDVPIQLSGSWLGILGSDGKTEVDLVPPYDVDLLVQDASTRDYNNAFLTVRVPANLGHPITKDDVRSSL
ncbi:MAG: hypothetical protein QOG21_244 [Actinomycetota bacterium]|jgi:hypothetical protein|nr:hypothetical protein [Actinomycetota bacterium]